MKPNILDLDPAVHPRTCGEQYGYYCNAYSPLGSSPHVRGTAFPPFMSPGVARFIPARAGNRSSHQPGAGTTPVHPRTCGEQTESNRYTPFPFGSSPHVRGTVPCCQCQSVLSRFIPARAGNRPNPSVWSTMAAVHPRTCGEQITSFLTKSSPSGSSPHVRGTGLL